MNRKDLQRHRVRLSGYEAKDETYAGLDLRSAVAQGSRWVNCTFDSVRFSLAALGDATFEGCVFKHCDFQQATLVSRIHGSLFESCNLDQANLTGAWITETSFSRCRAQYSVWERATLDKVRLDCDLRGADFNPCLTKSVDFTGSNLWSTRLPINCATLSGNTFDERQIGGFLAMLGTANLPPTLAERLRRACPERYRRLVERVLRESNDLTM